MLRAPVVRVVLTLSVLSACDAAWERMSKNHWRLVTVHNDQYIFERCR